MVLAKFGFTAQAVWAMPVQEVIAWVDTYLESQGIKPKGEGDGAVVSARIPLSELKQRQQAA